MTQFIKFPGADRFVNLNHVQWFEAFDDTSHAQYKSRIWLSPSPQVAPVDASYRSYFYSTETPEGIAAILNGSN